MKNFFCFVHLHILHFLLQEAQILKYPCSSVVDNYKINKGLGKWPKFKKGQTLKLTVYRLSVPYRG